MFLIALYLSQTLNVSLFPRLSPTFDIRRDEEKSNEQGAIEKIVGRTWVCVHPDLRLLALSKQPCGHKIKYVLPPN